MDVLLVDLALALVLALVGRWGRENADGLVPHAFPEKDRARKIRALRRGGGFCYVLACAFVVSGVVAVV